MDTEDIRAYEDLMRDLRSRGRVAVAFSAGVDSALLLYAAHDALGEGAMALTAASPFFSPAEVDAARSFCEARGIAHEVVEYHPLDIDEVAANGRERCYWCKLNLLATLRREAAAHGAQLVEGSNASDAAAYRPGARALAELAVASPLAHAGIGKAQVRRIARALGLDECDKPSQACLATRFPYDEPLSEGRLSAVDAAERFLRERGFAQVRVRAHGDVARIEIDPSEFSRALSEELREEIYEAFRAWGFRYTALDLLGYRTGSADEG